MRKKEAFRAFIYESWEKAYQKYEKLITKGKKKWGE